MIDIDKIEAQCNLAIQNGYGHLPVIECGNTVKISELISLLRQFEKDAERYRWLRDKSVDLDWVVEGEEKTHVDITVWHNDGFDSANHGIDATPEEIGALIDEAMKCNQK